MKVVKILLPGRFEDAFIYMGRIVVFTERRTVQLWDLDKIAEYVSEVVPHSNPVPSLMFSRNDWISSGIFHAILRNRDVATSIASAFDLFPQPFFEVKTEQFQISEQDLEIPARVLLDMNIYQSRIYIGADSGLYHVDVDWEDDKKPLQGRPRKRTDARCIRTSVGFGTVNASCGSEGLLSAVNEFGWIERGTESKALRKVADESLRSAWLYSDLMNYSSSVLPLLLKSEYEIAPRGETRPEREYRVVTAIGTERIDLTYLFDIIHDQYGVEKESIQYTYNSSSVIFIHTIDGNFYSLGIRTPRQGRPQLKFRRTYKGAQTRILSANATSAGLVVETDHRILLFSRNDWFPILESEVISVRTFPRSRRYRNIVALTTENGVIIVGLFDELSSY